jgi:hypothetical protein
MTEETKKVNFILIKEIIPQRGYGKCASNIALSKTIQQIVINTKLQIESNSKIVDYFNIPLSQ